MGDISLEMIWKRLDDLHTGQTTLMQKMDTLDQKVGSLGQTLLSVQRDVRDVRRELATLSVVVDEHTRRLDQIEKHLGLNAERH